ncbi:sulfatase-like hydrolase/transferase [Halobaculum limi]|uniref:sulfatase-like hydrolase/transferase n=1 Tax=Halobaculum limi TaxID=3031916 RepID=UPI002405A6D2|nr:sulfatase-like hydrolase/transferase [Halobaculum sp. YSMS11]
MNDVAVVVLDTLRYDSFNEHFDWLPGKRFENCYSTSHWTIPAHASLFTGKYPSEIAVHGKSPSLSVDFETLPELLSNQGYHNSLFSANPQITMWDGWESGFDTFVGPSNLSIRNDDVVDWEEFYANNESSGIRKYVDALRHCFFSDGKVLPSIRQGIKMELSTADGGSEKILERLRNTSFESDNFLFLNIMDAHTPYDPPEEYCDVDTPVDVVLGDALSDNVDDPDEIREAYNGSVEYLSDMYEKIFSILEKQFDYVITLSDHGEMLGEQDLWNHSYGIYPELTHVPLVISGSNCKSESRKEVVSILDVHKTICEMCGVSADSRGQDLLSSVDSRDYVVEYHGLLKWHLAQFEKKGVAEDMYNQLDCQLSGFVDRRNRYAYEEHDGCLTSKSELSETEAESILEDLIAELDRKEITASTMDVDTDVMSRLEDLGYA